MEKIFKHCPNCTSTNIESPDNVRFLCRDCGFAYFHNIAVAVAVVSRYEGKVLFTVQNMDSGKGKLDLPGGFIDPNETAQEAACREVLEKVGMQISPSQLCFTITLPNNYLYKEAPYRVMDIFSECRLAGEQVRIMAPDEIKALQWFPLNEAPEEQIGFVSVRTVIQ